MFSAEDIAYAIGGRPPGFTVLAQGYNLGGTVRARLNTERFRGEVNAWNLDLRNKPDGEGIEESVRPRSSLCF